MRTGDVQGNRGDTHMHMDTCLSNLHALACKRCCDVDRAQCHRGVNFLTDISVLEVQSNSQASHLQAPESVANRPSRKGAFASLHALNVSMTAVGFACSIAVKRKPATSVSLPDQT